MVSGVVTGLVLAAASPLLGPLFTADHGGARRCWPRCSSSPRSASRCAGVVFVLDGVLIGAGDGAYLAWAGLVVLVVYAPVVLVVAAQVGARGLFWVWVVFSVVFMGARAVVLLRRERGDAWLVLGAR